MRGLRCVGILWLALLWSAQSYAQEQVFITAINEEEAATNVPVEMVVDGERQRLATTDASGTAAIDFDLVNLGKGQEVDVYEVECAGETIVVMVPKGESFDWDAFHEEHSECRRRRVGIIVWWETESLRIGDGFEPRVEIGFKLDAAFWPEFEDGVCGRTGVASCDVDDSTIAPVVFAELLLNRWLGLGIKGLWSSLEGTQNLASDGGAPATSRIDMSVAGLGPYASARLRLTPRVAAFLQLGLLYLWNTVDLETESPGDRLVDEREQSGVRVDVGTGIDIDLTDRFGIRVNFDYVSAGSEDQDRSYHLGGGVKVRMGGTP